MPPRPIGQSGLIISGGPPRFDPATLALSGWFRGRNYNYDVGTPDNSRAIGTASAGPSGGRQLFPGGGQVPTVGPSRNGFASVHYDAAVLSSLNGFDDISQYITPSAWSVAFFGTLIAEPANSPAGFLNGALVQGAGGNWSIAVRQTNPTLQAEQWGAGIVAVKDFTNGVPTMFAARCGGGLIQAAVNNVWGPALAVGNIAGLAGLPRFGRGFSGLSITADIWEHMLAQTRFADADFDGIFSYFKSEYLWTP